MMVWEIMWLLKLLNCMIKKGYPELKDAKYFSLRNYF